MGREGDELQPNMLRQLPVRPLLPDQLRLYRDTLIHKVARTFNPDEIRDRLLRGQRTIALAFDIGGDKLTEARYTASEGAIEAIYRTSHVSTEGQGFIEFLTKAARTYPDLPAGISWAGETSGTAIVSGSNLTDLVADMQRIYGRDFASLFSQAVLANDAEAGAIASILKVTSRKPEVKNVVYYINGSGVGGAVWKNGVLYACEPGHVEVVNELNLFDQKEPCVLFPQIVCCENVSASKKGVVNIWNKLKGESAKGPRISAEYQKGDQTALQLYDNSALVAAHAITGMAEIYGLDLTAEDTMIVFHGGTFFVPEYGERIGQFLGTENFVMTKDIAPYACLDGAAALALSMPEAA